MPHDSNHDTSLFERLLQYDVEKTGADLGLFATPSPISNELAAQLLNLAERYSHGVDDHSRRVCLAICGLLTEYARDEWAAAPGFIVNILSRIGLAPSMQMADPTYNSDTGTYAPLGSFAAEVAVVSRCVQMEVTAAGAEVLLLSEFQHRAWKLIAEHRRVGISAPTSAGKSYILVYKTLDILWHSPGMAVFIVPTLSLIHQVSRDLRQAASRLKMDSVGIYQSYLDGVATRHANTIFVLTQERALAAFEQHEALRDCRIVVIDEVQNVERVANEGDERARTLLEVIHEFESGRNSQRIVISGPRVENIGQLAKAIFGPSAVHCSAELPPVVNITYTFAEAGTGKTKATVLNQYIDVSETARTISLTDADKIRTTVFSKQTYNDGIHDIIASLLSRLCIGHGTLVFSPTPSQATQTAIELAKRLQLPGRKRMDELASYISETVHENYALVECLVNGVAFHHGKMPQHVRFAVESAFAAEDISAMVCTTTLMQGINLPAKNLIARNPNLFLKQSENSPKLTPYEFANLRGRAGRLMKDFVGRSLILDESFFPDVSEYVSSPGKDVVYGFGQRFEDDRKEILSQLLNPPHIADSASDLVKYIRHVMFVRGEDALGRLARVGISLTDQEFGNIAKLLLQLTVPKTVAEKNPSWDPYDLQTLFDAEKKGLFPILPKQPFENRFVERITDTVIQIKRLTPEYFFKYIGDKNDRYVRWAAVTAQNWCSEDSLKQIIGWSSNNTPLTWKVIDDRLALLTNLVVYKLPRLISPISTMQDPKNPLLGFIELGAYRPDSRRLIELGLPRETAIRCTSKFAKQLNNSTSDEELIKAAMMSATTLNYWDQIQVAELQS